AHRGGVEPGPALHPASPLVRPSRGAPITPAPATLPTLAAQAQRLLDLDVHTLAGLPAEALTAAAERWGSTRTDALLAIDPALAPPSALTPLLRRGGKPGFVVEDMTDVDSFAPTGVELGGAPLHLVEGPARGARHRAGPSMPAPRRCGSATARGGTAGRGRMLRSSAGAGGTTATPGSASPPPRGAARCDSRPSCAGGLCQERRSCRAPWTI